MLCFSMICVSAGSKSNLAKAAGAEVAVERRHEKLHAAVARSTFWSQNVQNTACSDHFSKLRCGKIARRCGEKHFEVKMYKTLHARTTFWSCDVEKVHAAVARSTFWSQNVKKLTRSDHFLKFRCRKIARRCGEKRICKSKCTKHLRGRTTFWSCDVEKLHAAVARSTVKMLKNWRSRSTFWSSDVEKLHAVVARSTFASENVQNTCVLHNF